MSRYWHVPSFGEWINVIPGDGFLAFQLLACGLPDYIRYAEEMEATGQG